MRRLIEKISRRRQTLSSALQRSRAVGLALPQQTPSQPNSGELANWTGSAFGRRCSIKKNGSVETANFDITSGAKKNMREHCPTTGNALGVILEELDINYSDYTFVDCGCDRDQVHWLAAEFPFSKIIRAESSDVINETSNENISHMSAKRENSDRIQATHRDASAFRFPNSPLVLYFFYRLGKAIMARILDNVKESWNAMPRDIVIVYSNPSHRELLDASNFWTTEALSGGPVNEGWAVYRTPAF